jgi:hypothetical protein
MKCIQSTVEMTKLLARTIFHELGGVSFNVRTFLEFRYYSDLRFPLPETLGDFYSYDVEKLEWKVLVTTGQAPGIRSEMGMVAAAGRVFVFGGSAATGEENQTEKS